MANSHNLPYPGDFGEEQFAVTRTLPATIITAEATVRHFLPIVANEVSRHPAILYYKGGAWTQGSATSDFTGATTARIVKRSSAGTITPLSATVSLTDGETAGTVLVFPILSTATDIHKTIRPSSGDSLAIEVTNASGGTVTTQPGDVQVGVLLAKVR